MIGRKQELKELDSLYKSKKFEFLIMYGRRRIGKTTILQEFSKKHKTIFFSAQEKNDALNLLDFSKLVQNYFDNSFISSFENWKDAFDYIGKKAKNNRIVLIIDEFPFLANSNPTIKSILQHIIDLSWEGKNIFLILCGSSVSFMVNDVMGYKSPLYGRITRKMEIKPFDYLESSLFFPDYTNLEKLIAYGILGGVPRYLKAFDPHKSLIENIISEILDENAFLNDEPQILLRMELREPAIYNSILEAVSNGANKITEISDKTHEEKSKCSKYILVLQDLRLLEKIIPCGENESSKKGIYQIKDNFYKFWYKYVFSRRNRYSYLGKEKAAEDIMQEINEYMGPIFEDICKEYLVKLAQKGELEFVPYSISRWWGNNPSIKSQDDIDILALDQTSDKAIFCECKFKNKPMPMDEYEDLLNSTKAFPSIKQKQLMFFSKSGYSAPVIRRAREDGALLLTVDDLFICC